MSVVHHDQKVWGTSCGGVTKRAWFGPKKYIGWGWNVSTWQGVVVTVLAGILIAFSLVVLHRTAAGYFAAVLVVVVYLGVVVLTGDPPGGPKRST